MKRILITLHDRAKLLKEKSEHDIIARPIKAWNQELIDSVDMVFPQTEKQIRLIHEKFNVTDKFFMPSKEVFELCDDKVKFNNFLIENGFEDNVPKMDTKEAPYMIKPIIGIASQDIKLIKENGHNPFDKRKYFSQKYEMGDFEYSVTVVYDKGIKFIRNFTHRMKDFSTGYKDSHSQGIVPRKKLLERGIIIEEDLSDEGLKFVDMVLWRLNFKGVCNIQFTVFEGTMKIFEINPRINGLGRKYVNEIAEAGLEMVNASK